MVSESDCGSHRLAVEVAVSSGEVYVPKKPSNQDTDISPAQRDEAVRWLADVHHQLKLYPETLCLAVSILDRFLSAIKKINRIGRLSEFKFLNTAVFCT
ncbi:hypothetical protein AOLI_G00201900 [Acnodon oligacanthus]